MHDPRSSKTLLFLSIAGVSVALSFLLPFLHVLEILIIACGLLCLVWLVSVVDNQIHLHQIKQQWRNVNFQRFKKSRPSDPDQWSLH